MAPNEERTLDGFGFWIFMGLFLAAIIYSGSRERIEKQRTLQRLLERNEPIDEDLVNRLLAKESFGTPGTAYRRLRAIGAFGMVVSILVGVLAYLSVAAEENTPMSGAVTAGIVFFLIPFFVGLGLFVASKFCKRPDQGSEKA